jgi:tetratricopeptide (TPR) repeat protein
MTYFHLSMIHAQNGKLEEAVRAAEKAYSRAPWNLGLTGYFAGLMERTGDTKRAAEMLQHLGDGEAYHAPLGFFFYALLCGEAQQAANWAEKAIEQRSPTITTALRYPLAKDLRSSSRWPALVKMMNQAG